MLTDLAVKNLRAKSKPYRKADGGGLYVWVTPAGGKYWRWRYQREGREQILSLGAYPQVKAAEARDKRDEARQRLKNGGDPSAPAVAVAVSAGPPFAEVMDAWLTSHARVWAPRHTRKVRQALDKWVTPALGNKAIETITTGDINKVYQPLDAQGAGETLRQIRERINRIFLFAEGQGLIVKNPARVAGQGLAPQIKGRNPAITDLDELRRMLAAVDAVPARPVTRLALRLLALTAVRQGELRIATWPEFHGLDGDAPEWRIPVSHMKIPLTKRLGLPDHHRVPLSAQAVDTIAALRTLTGQGPLPFPSAVDPHRPMSENALSELLIRAGYKDRHVPHGFRASFSTIMNELHRADRLMIDYMLAHKLRDQVEGAYNRGEHHARRRELAQIWADLIMKDAPPATALLDYARRPRSPSAASPSNDLGETSVLGTFARSVLTDLAIRNLKPQAKPYRKTDGGGLYLWVTPAGGRYWRWRYERAGGREKVISLGAYPEVSAAEARKKRDEARRILKAGGDPVSAQKSPARLRLFHRRCVASGDRCKDPGVPGRAAAKLPKSP